jgi:hypothetical protein
MGVADHFRACHEKYSIRLCRTSTWRVRDWGGVDIRGIDAVRVVFPGHSGFTF